jgi:hypothetical protein
VHKKQQYDSKTGSDFLGKESRRTEPGGMVSENFTE